MGSRRFHTIAIFLRYLQEFVDVMDGELSDNFEYFRTLVVRGFLEARKHAERLFLLLEMMLTCEQ